MDGEKLDALSVPSYFFDVECKDDTTTVSATAEIRIIRNTPPYFTQLIGTCVCMCVCVWGRVVGRRWVLWGVCV